MLLEGSRETGGTPVSLWQLPPPPHTGVAGGEPVPPASGSDPVPLLGGHRGSEAVQPGAAGGGDHCAELHSRRGPWHLLQDVDQGGHGDGPLHRPRHRSRACGHLQEQQPHVGGTSRRQGWAVHGSGAWAAAADGTPLPPDIPPAASRCFHPCPELRAPQAVRSQRRWHSPLGSPRKHVCCCPHFAEEGTETQRSPVLCPGSRREQRSPFWELHSSPRPGSSKESPSKPALAGREEAGSPCSQEHCPKAWHGGGFLRAGPRSIR